MIYVSNFTFRKALATVHAQKSCKTNKYFRAYFKALFHPEQMGDFMAILGRVVKRGIRHVRFLNFWFLLRASHNTGAHNYNTRSSTNSWFSHPKPKVILLLSGHSLVAKVILDLRALLPAIEHDLVPTEVKVLIGKDLEQVGKHTLQKAVQLGVDWIEKATDSPAAPQFVLVDAKGQFAKSCFKLEAQMWKDAQRARKKIAATE